MRLALLTMVLASLAADTAAGETLASFRPLEGALITPRTVAHPRPQAPSLQPVPSPRAPARLGVGQNGSFRLAPLGLPARLEDGAPTRRDDVSLARSWPGALNFSNDRLDFKISPHASFGVSDSIGEAEGGATLTVSRTREDRAVERLRDLGVADGAQFGDRGRWYLFVAASGRAVGLNMLHDDRGWDRAGWSTDPTASLVGDAQLGVGWRKGDVQSAVGLIHREVKGRHMVFGQETRADNVLAFTFSIRPGR